MSRLAGFVLATFCCSVSFAARCAPSDRSRQAFESLVQDVTHSTGRTYGAVDSAGHTMDTVKIISDPAGGYLGVYHSMAKGVFDSHLAVSTDLMHWTFCTQLGTHASQPYIYDCGNGGFVVAWEQDPNNHIRVNYYTNRSDLLSGTVSRSFDAPQTLSPCAEGTPSIYSVKFTTSPADISSSIIDIGAHYYQDCKADRQQRGTLTNFQSWVTSPQGDIDKAVEAWGVRGNIGDRDALEYKGHLFGLIEGMFKPGDWASWDVYCYDYSTGKADKLSISTDKGSTAFANPSCSIVPAPKGSLASGKAVVVTLFIPSEGAAPGEGGELIYYRTFH